MPFHRQTGVLLATIAAACLAGGCGEQRVKVHGNFSLGKASSRPPTKAPKNLPPQFNSQGERVRVPSSVDFQGLRKEHVLLVFHRIDEGKDPRGDDIHAASVKEDGTYEVSGIDGRGIRPGEYRVAVVIPTPFTFKDKLKGRFSPEKSPIVREVSKGVKEQEIDIDIDNP